MVSELQTQRGRSRSRSRERVDGYISDRMTRDVSPRGLDQEPSRAKSRSPVPGDGQDPGKERRRPTWFDIQPVAGAPPPISDLPGVVQVIPENVSGNLMSSSQSGVANQQATRHARRIYIGGLPVHTKEGDIATFFSNALAAVGGTTAGPGPCVINVYINYEKKFAFAELRTVEEASNAMALDGVMFEGVTVRVRRPADYDPVAAAKLGPSAPNPNLNLAAIALDKSKPQGRSDVPIVHSNPYHDDPNRLFVGGLPYYLSEEECKELLGTFGKIKYFGLIRDRATGVSKGYGFVIYEDNSVIEAAIAGLNGMKLGERTLSVRKAEIPSGASRPVVVSNAEDGTQQTMFTAAKPRVVKLVQAVTIEELEDDEEYEDILEDMKEEMNTFGQVEALHIPRPQKDGGSPPPGVGKILVKFSDSEDALRARNKLHGRKFGGRVVEAILVTQEDYEEKRWD